MKQTISTSTMFKLILVFTILFASFLSLAIVYNKVYRIKNETVSIVERYEGFSVKSMQIINNYLKNNSYKTKGNCQTGEYGVKDFDQKTPEQVNNLKDKYYYCISARCSAKGCKINDNNASNGNKIYYQVRLFFKFDIPYIGELLTFDITGETKGINLYSDSQRLTMAE